MATTKYLFPWNNQNAINYNILLLTQYYTQKQHKHFTDILNINFNQEQMRDSRYTPPPHTYTQTIPYATYTSTNATHKIICLAHNTLFKPNMTLHTYTITLVGI